MVPQQTTGQAVTQMKIIKTIASLAGVTAVGLGAFGAHGLRPQLTANGRLEVWETGVLYHLIHAVALLAVAFLVDRPRSSATQSSPVPRIFMGMAACWAVGILLFSGSLYILALYGTKWLGPVTPVGGLFFIVGWILVAFIPSRKHP